MVCKLLLTVTRLFTVLSVSFFFSAAASAQVFDPGPSDPALFTNVFSLPGDRLPFVVGGVAGETTQINVASGGSIRSGFDANSGSEVNISGGTTGGFSADSAELNISGGTVEGDIFAQGDSVVDISGGTQRGVGSFDGSVVNISDGTVGGIFSATDDSVVNISGGTVGRTFFNVSGRSVVNISGGTIGPLAGFFEGVINISGGIVESGLDASGDGAVNLFGSDFVLDGVLLDNLIEGQAFTILDRDVTLSGMLEDGHAFSFDLNSNNSQVSGEDHFSPSATLTVTLTPQLLLGDCNLDGVVNFSDIGAFISILSVGDYRFQADTNEDGAVDFLDIQHFIALLSS